MREDAGGTLNLEAMNTKMWLVAAAAVSRESMCGGRKKRLKSSGTNDVVEPGGPRGKKSRKNRCVKGLQVEGNNLRYPVGKVPSHPLPELCSPQGWPIALNGMRPDQCHGGKNGWKPTARR